MTVAIIGKTLADAQAYRDKHDMQDAVIISPLSFNARYWRLAGSVERYYVTRQAFTHPDLHKLAATIQTYMRRRTKTP